MMLSGRQHSQEIHNINCVQDNIRSLNMRKPMPGNDIDSGSRSTIRLSIGKAIDFRRSDNRVTTIVFIVYISGSMRVYRIVIITDFPGIQRFVMRQSLYIRSDQTRCRRKFVAFHQQRTNKYNKSKCKYNKNRFLHNSNLF